jgi:hypothetical protein
VLAELPGVDFCAAARMPSSEDQVRADELLTLIQQDRVDGSIACSGGANIGASPPLHLDGRLVCAARVKAQDQAESGITGPVDSLGRDAPERLGLATYAYSNWWESYAFAAKTTSQAYALLLADAVSCPELGNPAYSAVGVGVVGDVFVVTLASE